MRDLVLPTITVPNYPVVTTGGQVDPGEFFLWQREVQETKKRIAQVEEKRKRTYAPVIEQCSPNLESKIQGSSRIKVADKDQDTVAQLLIIWGRCCQFDKHQGGTWALK